MFVKATHTGNTLKVRQRLVAHRLAAALGQYRTRMPVDPHGFAAQGLGQGRNSLLHLRPLAGAQGCARGPHHVVFVHLVKAAFGKVVQRDRVSFLGRAFGNHAPNPAALLTAELGTPAQFFHLHGGVLRLQIGLANQRHGHKLPGLWAQRGELVVEVFSRVEVNRVDGFDPLLIQRAHGLGGDAQTVVFKA